MSLACADHGPGGDAPVRDRRFRRVLWIALGLNAAMFLVEAAVGFGEGSLSLQADALDFLGDSASYAISLLVIGASLQVRAVTALAKGLSMALFGGIIAVNGVVMALSPGLPGAAAMGAVGALALMVNIACAMLLFRDRMGDANRRSVWICSRNDAIGNLAVLLAASGVFATGTPWPDLFVGGVMALLALWGAAQIIRHARAELG